MSNSDDNEAMDLAAAIDETIGDIYNNVYRPTCGDYKLSYRYWNGNLEAAQPFVLWLEALAVVARKELDALLEEAAVSDTDSGSRPSPVRPTGDSDV